MYVCKNKCWNMVIDKIIDLSYESFFVDKESEVYHF